MSDKFDFNSGFKDNNFSYAPDQLGLGVNGQSLVANVKSRVTPQSSWDGGWSANQKSTGDFISSNNLAAGYGSNNDILKAPSSEPHSYLGDFWKGAKGMFSPEDSMSSMNKNHENYMASAGKSYVAPTTVDGIVTSPGSGMDEKTWTDQMQKQQGANDHTFGVQAGTIMGGAQLGLGLMSYLDNKKMNSKNMELMDGQIANNNDIMATRKARASDIAKYFG